MSLLTLSPEATRLRRIAKACAAGELSRLEYREARRRVIEQFVSTSLDRVEDTVPRFDLDITQRRRVVKAAPPAESGRQNRLVWMLLLSLLFAGLTLPVWAAGTAQIPPVAERDPNPVTAPTYVVNELVWAVPDELDDVSGAEVASLLASELATMRRNKAPQPHGFNDGELAEVARFLNAVGVHDNAGRLSAGDLEDLRALIAAQKERRGISLAQLEQAAQALQQWLRARGYPLARAYVPAQSVRDGRVEIGVQVGTLSGITVTGAQGAPMQYRLAELLGKPVRRAALETHLNALNRTRGIRTEASFTPGAQVGESELTLRVKQQQRLVGSVAVDNYGVEQLGEERVSIAGQWNNPRGVGDALSLNAFTTINPADHRFGELGYATPVLGGRLDAAAQLAVADIQFATGAQLEGDGVLFDAQLTDTQLLTRTRGREVELVLGLHDFDWDVVAGQRAWFAGGGLRGHRLWDEHKLALAGSVQALLGGLDEERIGQDSDFWRVRAELNAWTPVDLPMTDVRAKLVLDVRAQAANDLLPPTLRLGATGPYANKGFSQGVLLLDQGVAVNGALRFDAPLGQWWLFLDNVYGEREGLQPDWVHLGSVGLGWEAELLQNAAGSLSSRITLGYPITHRGKRGFEHDGTQIFWALRFAR